MSDPNSPQVKFLYEYLQAVQRKDLDHLAKCFHKDYRNTRYPRSLGMPERNKEEHLEYVAGIFNIWTEFEHTVHSITDTPGKIIYHVTFTAKTSDGVEITRESISIKHMITDEDGSLKIKQGEEFTDSKAYLDAIKAVAVARAKGQ